ncbi:MAG: GNAT family N-acetyltransferase [Candidatus Thorarchaeota archaeon]
MTTNKDTEINIFDNTTRDLEFIIRRCTIEDLDAVIEINERELPEDYPYFFYKSILDNFPEGFLVAQNRKGDVIAYIMWRVEKAPSFNSLKYVNMGHLVSIAVSEKYRKKGVAHVLLSSSMAAIKKHKIKQYVLEVRVSNYSAIRLYEKFNYKVESIKQNYYRDGENAYYMTLDVKKS